MKRHLDFTKKELALIRKLRTPGKVQAFLTKEIHYNYERGGVSTFRSLRRVVRDGRAHCLEGAVAAAAILLQHGYTPLIACMEASDLDHNIFIYRHKGAWGSVSKSRDPNLLGREPVHRTLWDLVYSYYPYYYNIWTGNRKDITLRGYARVDLRRFRRDWITSEEDLHFIEDHLWRIQYRRLFPRNRRRLYRSPRS